jgi:hypothetical protein
MLRCAQSSRINVLNTYASARRSIARRAYEIFDQPANKFLANYELACRIPGIPEGLARAQETTLDHRPKMLSNLATIQFVEVSF